MSSAVVRKWPALFTPPSPPCELVGLSAGSRCVYLVPCPFHVPLRSISAAVAQSWLLEARYILQPLGIVQDVPRPSRTTQTGRNEALVLRQPMGLTGQEPGAALSRLHGGGGSEVTLGGLGGENSRCSCRRGGAQRAIVCRIQNPCVLPRADMLKDPLYMPAQKPPCFRLFVYVNFSGASNYEAEQPERRARC